MKNKKIEFIIVLISFISSIIGVFVVNGIIVGVPYIGREFNMNNIVQNWIPTILVYVVTMCTIPSSQIAGKIGFKKSLILGSLIILVGFIGTSLSFSTETFLFFRIIQGIGIALSNISEIALIVLIIPEENRGKALGITATGVYVGTSLAPVISGFLIDTFGWRSIFYFSIPFIIICIFLMILKLDGEWKVNENDRIDYNGMILYMAGICLFIYGFTDLISKYGQISVIIGIVILIGFVLYELKQKSPVFNVRLFKIKPFAMYNLAGLLGFFAVMIVTTIFNYHFQYVMGWSARLTGLILIISPIFMSITAVNAGRLSDKYHPQKIAIIGLILATLSFIILTFMDKTTPIYIIVIAMILQATGMGLFSSPNMNAIMSSVSKKDVSSASGSQLTMRAIGQTMSLSLLILVFSWIMGDLKLSSAYSSMIVQSSHIICVFSAIACIIGILLSIYGIKSEEVTS